MATTGGWAVVTASEMRSLEKAAFDAGISEAQLQANAAGGVAAVAEQLAPDGMTIVVLVGPGNNGRDAFLAGRLLARGGRRVSYYLGPRHAIASAELAALEPPGEEVRQHAGEADLEVLRGMLAGAGLAIDGLLGIGVRGAPRPPLDALAGLLNEISAASELLVLSVDVPSGIDADGGAVEGEAVRADVTVALGAVKAGTLRFPAAAQCGRIEVRPIALPPGVADSYPIRVLSRESVARLVPKRPLEAHKGTLGWVLVVGGSREYVGAPILSAAAAARSGCGLVGLAVPQHVQGAAAVALPEATYVLRDDRGEPGAVVERIAARFGDFEALVLGPGLGRDEHADGLVRGLLARLRADGGPRLVIDADALYALSRWARWSDEAPAGSVLTTHHGEMARLMGLSATEVGVRTWDIALEAAATWRQVVVLKGAHTVVAAPDGTAWVHPYANPGLATAGTGDVLAGLIGGLVGQGMEPLAAARLAVVAHGLAAERILGQRGWRSLLASDLLPEIPEVLRRLAGDKPRATKR